MTRVVYFTACTLDGFIADEHDSLDWLFEVPHTEDDGSWDAFIGRIGPLVMGATTYQWTLDQHFTEPGCGLLLLTSQEYLRRLTELSQIFGENVGAMSGAPAP